jgi:hypothetical protein
MVPVGSPEERLNQGDLIFQCPILVWKPGPVVDTPDLDATTLSQFIDPFETDAVVMTQACDMEHNKVDNVVLCPHVALSEFKKDWEDDQRNHGQNPTPKCWRALCENIRDRYLWNYSLLNAEEADGFKIDRRVVDFHEVYTIPRIMLESLIRKRNEARPQLLPPYREHLSRAFARYFMRVGLPTGISTAW